MHQIAWCGYIMLSGDFYLYIFCILCRPMNYKLRSVSEGAQVQSFLMEQLLILLTSELNGC